MYIETRSLTKILSQQNEILALILIKELISIYQKFKL